MELNSTLRIPRDFRYNLDIPGEPLPGEASPGPEDLPVTDYDAATAREKLREAKAELLDGKVTPDFCRRLEQSMLRSETFASAVHYTSLLETPHTALADDAHSSPNEEIDSALGFLTPEHDMAYTDLIDSGEGFTRTGDNLTSPNVEREVGVRNPASVYNWLRKHQPHLLPDGETTSEKPAAAKVAGQRSSKRAPAPVPKEEDVFDDDGILLDVDAGAGGGSSRGKRKRDQDGGYRPKGGGSRSRKRKDESSKRAKRSSGVNPAA